MKLATPNEAAAELKISAQLIRSGIKTGRFPCLYLGTHMMVDLDQLRDILESKDIHPIVDIWGQDVSHDWYWWEKQWVYFLEMTLGKA